MSVYDQIKAAFQDIVAPEIRALHGEIKTLQVEIKRLDEKVESAKNELLSEIRRLDTRIDSLDRELKTAMDVRERLIALEAKARS